MTEQLGFNWAEETAFDRFHTANPHVYASLVRLAREWVSRFGGRKVGIGALYEVARWEIALATDDADFKLNNNFRAYYARLIMAQEPELDGLFDLRASKADQWIAGVA